MFFPTVLPQASSPFNKLPLTFIQTETKRSGKSFTGESNLVETVFGTTENGVRKQPCKVIS